MSSLVTCPNGHRWEFGADGTSAEGICPVCGAAVGPETETVPPRPAHGVQSGEAETTPPQPAPSGAATPILADHAPARAAVPGYELLGELGRGGMGVVYKARQVKLGRLVALKMILAGGYASEHDLARFRAEAESIARLQHANIVQVYEVGEHNGLPYFSLEFCAGGSLAGQLDGTPLPPKLAAQKVEILARAMHAAHQAGVVHRDLKPANVLLTADAQLKVTDFGLAKKLDAAGPTATGAVMGTPSYMAPEQAGGKGTAVGPAADVYALGAILYELLTGRPPFKAATPLDTVLQVISGDPVPPRQLQPKTPKDLETLCLKAIAKEPRRRYASAEALADDLQRFQRGEPVVARPVGKAGRLWLWAKRNPSVAGLSAAVALALVLGTSISTYYAVLANRRAADRAAETERANDESKRAYARAYVSDIRMAQRAWEEKNFELAQDLLAATRPERTGGRDFRHFEWYYWSRLCGVEERTLQGHTRDIDCVAFSPDGRRIATASSDGTVKLWDVERGQVVYTLEGHDGAVGIVTFSPDGRRIAYGAGTFTLKVWDVEHGQTVCELKSRFGPFDSVAFSPDGNRLTGASSSNLAVWDLQQRQELLYTDSASIGRMINLYGGARALRPDGKQFAFGARDQTVKLWSVERGQVERSLKGHVGEIYRVAFSPDGKWLASASIAPAGQPPLTARHSTVLKIWDVERGELHRTLEVQGGRFHTVAFSPDGRRLAGDAGRTVELWDVEHGKRIRTLQHAGDAGLTVELWDAENGKSIRTRQHFARAASVVFSPDGKRLACASGRTVKLWDEGHSQEQTVRTLQHVGVKSVAFSPRGRRLASGSTDGTVKLWDVDRGQVIRSLKGHNGAFHVVAFSPDGKRIGSAVASFTMNRKATHLTHLTVYDAEDGQLVSSFQWENIKFGRLAFSYPDGSRLAYAGGDAVKTWDVESGQEVRSRLTNTAGGVALGPNGKQLAFGATDGVVTLLDPERWPMGYVLEGHTGVVDNLAFSPDGKQLACAGADKTIRIWDTQCERAPLVLKGHADRITSLAFSGDGRRLISASWDQTLRVWDAAHGQELLTLRGHADRIICVAFSPDGRRLASASQDGTVRVWDGPIGNDADNDDTSR